MGRASCKIFSRRWAESFFLGHVNGSTEQLFEVLLQRHEVEKVRWGSSATRKSTSLDEEAHPVACEPNTRIRRAPCRCAIDESLWRGGG